MLIDNNLIAYEYFKNQYVPKEVYPSGERDETKLIDKYNVTKGSPAVLTLEEDIANDEGYGLKKGFYSVVPDKYMDFLLLYQGGNLKAKVPVFEVNVFETLSPKQNEIKKMSAKKVQKEQEKEAKKYSKGINPNELDYKTAEIYRIDGEKAYVLIFQTNYLELKGVIKF